MRGVFDTFWGARGGGSDECFTKARSGREGGLKRF